MSLTEITDAQFEAEVLKSDKPVLVDFWAPWCGPCKQLMPTVETVAGELTDVKFVKMNIDESPETPSSLGVRGIPTLMLFKDGKMVDASVGMVSQSDLTNWVNAKA